MKKKDKQVTNIIRIHFNELLIIDKFIDTGRMVVAKGWGEADWGVLG